LGEKRAREQKKEKKGKPDNIKSFKSILVGYKLINDDDDEKK
jgi:hypothetical protein